LVSLEQGVPLDGLFCITHAGFPKDGLNLTNSSFWAECYIDRSMGVMDENNPMNLTQNILMEKLSFQTLREAPANQPPSMQNS
jgi:hypothetical protein